MRKVSLRAFSAIILAVGVIAGLVIYVARYIKDGEFWALYFDSIYSGCTYTLTDRNGVILAEMGKDGNKYADDSAIREACFQLVGDYGGNVGTGAIRTMNRELSGYSLITGIKPHDDVTLKLSVDAEINRIAYEAMAGRNGAVMVVNYKTGEVPCMVSSAAIDPQNPPDELPDGAYLNRCISSVFVPGSIYKLVTLTAAIENIPDLYHRSFTCSGSIEVLGVKVNCTGHHGEQTIEQALANSCNCAFAELALELGSDTMAKYAEKLGLTTQHMFDNVATAKGNYEGDTSASSAQAWSGIGQYNDLVCPYSMLRMVSAVANGGTVVEPSLLGTTRSTTELLSADTAKKVADMMNYNVVYKYGESTFPGLNICAKTGTAEVGGGKDSHGWFVGFLRDDAHPYAFIVLVENGGSGIGSAGAVANTVLQALVKSGVTQ